jgi:tRNA nucleotidyltransferase (CCA-adding enzyme)
MSTLSDQPSFGSSKLFSNQDHQSTLLVGHTVNDLDCLGSLALAKYLFPQAYGAKSGRLHPAASHLYTLFRDHLSLREPKELRELEIDRLVVLDTRAKDKIEEYLKMLPHPPKTILVLDHHLDQPCTISGAELIESACGANTSLVAKLLMEQNISVPAETATIGLCGIYADTGSFHHDTLAELDFLAAGWLLHQGASLTIVKKLLNKLHHDHQHELFHRILGTLEHHTINGRTITLSLITIPKQLPGLAAIIDQMMEVEPCDALFVTFQLEREESHLIIGRARGEGINLNEALTPFGGGGHPQAASALLKHSLDYPIQTHLIQHLEYCLKAGTSAKDLMRWVTPIKETWSLLDASLHLERCGETGVAVVNDREEIQGMLTLRDIQKGRKHEQMHAPVKAYMSRKPVTAPLDARIADIERLFYTYDIGHLPIMENHKLLGMVTRSSYLAHLRGDFQS